MIAGTARLGNFYKNRPRTLQRYMVGEYLFSVSISFLFFLALFFVNQILVIARDRLAEQVSIMDTLRLILYAMPAIIALSVPFASFIGIILSVGKFAEGREILAARAGGVSFPSLLAPVLAAALLLTGASFFTNDYLLPLGTMNYTRLYQELLYSNSRLIIEPYSIRNYENSTIITGNVSDNTIDGIMIIDEDEAGERRTINAEVARLLRNDRQQGIITLQLEEVVVVSQSETVVQESRAERMDYNILLENIAFNLSNPSVREMSARDVYALMHNRHVQNQERMSDLRQTYNIAIQNAHLAQWTWVTSQNGADFRRYLDALQSIPDPSTLNYEDRTLRLYRIEFWKKFSIPLSALTFIFLGFPFGLLGAGKGRTLGIVLGLISASAYWGLLTAIDAVGLRLTGVSAFLITFSPNFLMLTIGGLMLHSYLRR